MKKITMLVVAAFMSTAMFAQRNGGGKVLPLQTSVYSALTEKPATDFTGRAGGLASVGMKKFDFSEKRLERAANAMKKAGRKGVGDVGIITEKPAGKEVVYSRAGGTYFVFFGYIDGEMIDESVGRVVFGEDNTVYIYNPISQLSTKSYMKGTIDKDGVVTVKLPQPIYAEEADGEVYVANVDRLVWVYDEEEDAGWFYRDSLSSTNEIKYVLRNDSLLWADDESGDVILGLVDVETGKWMGYGDWNTSFSPVTDTPVTLPDKVVAEDWVLAYDEDGRYVKVAVDGKDVYLGDLYDGLPGTWVKGAIDGNKVIFNSKQYLGPDDEVGYHTYFITAGGEQYYDEYWEDWISEYVMTDKIEFTYDADKKIMRADSKNDSTILVNAGKKSLYYVCVYDAPVIQYIQPVEGAVKPLKPVIVDFMPYDEGYGYGYIQFDLPKKDADGNFLDTKKMHYNLFVDDELFAFYQDEYVAIEEDGMTDIPYSYTDGLDIVSDGGVTHTIYYYFVTADKIGIQTTYTADNGESMKSDMTVYDIAATGIDSTKGVSTAVKSVKYVDMTGRAVSGSAKGMYVKTVTYADGTVKSMKVVRR